MKNTEETPHDAPMHVKIGSIKSEEQIVEHLLWVSTTPDHLILVSQMILRHMWEDADGAGKEYAGIIKDVQRDIHDLYDLAVIAKYLRKDDQSR